MSGIYGLDYIDAVMSTHAGRVPEAVSSVDLLSFVDKRIDCAEFSLVLHSLHLFPCLCRVILVNCRIDFANLDYPRHRRFPSVTELNISYNTVGDVVALANILRLFPSLTWLTMKSCGFSGDLSSALKLVPKLRRLDICGINVGSSSDAFSFLRHLPLLQSLIAIDVGVTRAGALSLAALLENRAPNLRFVNLKHYGSLCNDPLHNVVAMDVRGAFTTAIAARMSLNFVTTRIDYPD